MIEWPDLKIPPINLWVVAARPIHRQRREQQRGPRKRPRATPACKRMAELLRPR